VVTRGDLRLWIAAASSERKLGEVARREFLSAHPDETLRTVVYRMASTGLTPTDGG